MHTERYERFVQSMRIHGVDALAFVPGPNLFYLTGLSFSLSERPVMMLLPRRGRPVIVLPQLEAVKIGERDALVPFTYTDDEGHEQAFRRACAALDLHDPRVGVEGLRMRVAEARVLERCQYGCVLVPIEDLPIDLRAVKSGEELREMRSAVAITEAALRATIEQVQVGMTEREVASLVRIELLRGGGEVAFSPIVVSGANAALPHAVPSDRPIQAGETIIIDCGASFGGYVADITRTFVIGGWGAEWRHIYDVVHNANTAGRAAVGPGVPAEEVDRATRAVIEGAGYGEHFIHRTGHGIGLEVHEPPYIVEGNQRSLEPGMTFTVEPGIYVSARGGVRIEDDVLVTEKGAEALTTFTRELIVLP